MDSVLYEKYEYLFDTPMHVNSIPQSTTDLKFRDFNQKIPPNCIPMSVKK